METIARGEPPRIVRPEDLRVVAASRVWLWVVAVTAVALGPTGVHLDSTMGKAHHPRAAQSRTGNTSVRNRGTLRLATKPRLSPCERSPLALLARYCQLYPRKPAAERTLRQLSHLSTRLEARDERAETRFKSLSFLPRGPVLFKNPPPSPQLADTFRRGACEGR